MAPETEGNDPLIDGTPSLEDSLAEALLGSEQETPSGTETVDNGAPPDSIYTLSDGTQVSLDELEKGYLRQSDYTKKTQATAQERAEAAQALALMEALVENPEATLEALRNNLIGEEENLLDPTEAKLREYDQRFQTIEQQEFERELNNICVSLENQYADFDRMAVLEYASENNIPNLRAAYLDWREEMTVQQERQQHNAQALQAKRSAPPVAGRSTQLGGQVPEFRPVESLADAMANALLELQSNGS